MWKKILLGVAVVGVVLAVAVMRQPDDYKVTREIQVKVPPEAAYGLVSDFHKWDGWSPWAKLDPAMKVEYSGPANGVGAVYYWIGNSKVGEGRMTIRGAKPAERLEIDLEFVQPFPSKADTLFLFAPASEGTTVKWEMSGKHTLMSKAMCLVMSMDKMIGPDFEKGLTQLKAQAEAVKN